MFVPNMCTLLFIIDCIMFDKFQLFYGEREM